jgi:hypothetical protein
LVNSVYLLRLCAAAFAHLRHLFRHGDQVRKKDRIAVRYAMRARRTSSGSMQTSARLSDGKQVPSSIAQPLSQRGTGVSPVSIASRVPKMSQSKKPLKLGVLPFL